MGRSAEHLAEWRIEHEGELAIDNTGAREAGDTSGVVGSQSTLDIELECTDVITKIYELAIDIVVVEVGAKGDGDVFECEQVAAGAIDVGANQRGTLDRDTVSIEVWEEWGGVGGGG